MDKSKKRGIRAILNIRGQWDNNWILSRFKRLCLVFKAIISLVFFPITSFDYFDNGLEVGAYDCHEVGTTLVHMAMSSVPESMCTRDSGIGL